MDPGTASGFNLELKSNKDLEKCGFGKGTEIYTVLGFIFEDFNNKNDRKIDANLNVFSLFTAENAGNTIFTMVSEGFCIIESIKNQLKIVAKT